MNNFISIIVNCYNGERYVKNCLDSIKKQEYPNFELIFWDNLSSDQSYNIFKSYNDKRFKYFKSEKFLNLYEARNEAIKKTQHENIAFLDVDDEWSSNFLSSRKTLLEDYSYDFFYSNCYHYYEQSNIKKIFYKNKLPQGLIFNNLAKNYLVKISCLIIRKKILMSRVVLIKITI